MPSIPTARLAVRPGRLTRRARRTTLVCASLAFVSTHALAEPDASLSKQPTVVVLDAGAQPRRELRYSATPGSSYSVTQRQTVSTSMTIDENPAGSFDSPAIVSRVESTVASVSDDGNRIEMAFDVPGFSVDAEGADPAVVDAMNAQLMGATFKGVVVFDARGGILSVAIETNPAMAPELKQLIEGFESGLGAMIPPLPLEPVGIGATWRAEAESTINGLRTRNESFHTVDRFEGSKVFTRAMVRTESPAQQLPSPDGITQIRLVSSSGEGEGTTTIDLAHPGRVDGGVEMSVDQVLEVSVAELLQTLTQSIRMTTVLVSE